VISRGKFIANGAALAVAFSVYETRKRTTSELVILAQNIDEGSFNGWLAANGVSYDQIAAMWQTESAGNPRATNFTAGDGRQGGSWGIGQVTALTATDYRLPRIFAPIMLYPKIGARLSMSHIRAVIIGLRRAGFSGSHSEWVHAYNVGLTGFINGRRNVAHYQRFLTHLT